MITKEKLKAMLESPSSTSIIAYRTWLKEMLKEQDKYAWHDLRKNPEDLPMKDGNDESEYVLCLIGQPNWNHWEQAYYNYNKGMWSCYEQNVFAWKYIEPFEGGGGAMTDKKILSIYHKWLSKALDNPMIRKPAAWALYKTWKEVDVIEVE